ncbi:MAG: DUF4249 domain-containing protein [Cyclobacteriaceae bacterium]
MVNSVGKTISLLFLTLLMGEACVDRIDVDAESTGQGILVVDGFISDAEGPYVIRLFRTTKAENVLEASVPVIARSVVISDDTGKSEILTAKEDGVYRTAPTGIRGEIGRSYSLRVELIDGKVFESAPDLLSEGGQIDSLYYEWESVTPVGAPPRSGFRVYVNGNAPKDAFTRWRFSGAYMAQSFPELNKYEPNCSKTETGEPPPTPDPLPCSGYITTGIRTRFGLSIGNLIRVGNCTCCVCWVTDAEDKPVLNNVTISTEGIYNKIEVGYIPFDQWTFANKRYMLKVEQMSLSSEAFAFWKVIADQKNGSSSLFQPAFGKATTNMVSTNSDSKAIGYFYAASVSKKVLFLTTDDAPIPVPDPAIEPTKNCALWRDCTSIFPYSSYTQPAEWVD